MPMSTARDMRPLLSVLNSTDLRRAYAECDSDRSTCTTISTDSENVGSLKFLRTFAPAVDIRCRPSRPAAVTRFVVATVVDASQHHARRTFTHVSKKVGEAVQPTVAY